MYECLEFANKHFEVAVFTAGQKWFADYIIDYLDPDNKLFQHRYYRTSTSMLSKKQNIIVKDLSIFTRGELSLDDILIVDNNIYSFAFNLENGIPINDYLGNKSDKSLKQLMVYLDYIKDKANLGLENEKIYELRMIYNSNIEEYVQWYYSDQFSSQLDQDFVSVDNMLDQQSIHKSRYKASIFGDISPSVDSPNNS